MPRMLALMAVQRHAAASTSASPWRREQQGDLGGVPITTLIRPLRTLAQAPSLRVSLGQAGYLSPGGYAGLVVGMEGILGTGGGGQYLQETIEKKRRLRTTRRATEAWSLDAILL